jgi:hypothetical protein
VARVLGGSLDPPLRECPGFADCLWVLGVHDFLRHRTRLRVAILLARDQPVDPERWLGSFRRGLHEKQAPPSKFLRLPPLPSHVFASTFIWFMVALFLDSMSPFVNKHTLTTTDLR